MANPEHLAILRQGVYSWNRWREDQREGRPDLSSASLVGGDFVSANFRWTDLSHAKLVRAKLSQAKLTYANLARADLRAAELCVANLDMADLHDADLRDADLTRANLTDANLTRADLRGAGLELTTLVWANLNEVNLAEAHFRGCVLWHTTFANVDLAGAHGLDAVRHWGPSSIGIDTIYRSKGKIPEVFLRGAGVPEQFITYARSLAGQAIEFYTCFLSHSSKDQRFCARLYADLQAKGVRVWYFPEDARWGEPVWGEIDRSIRLYDKLVVVCSEHSLQSGPVLREIERALQREDREGKNILFPIRIDDYLFDECEHPRKADVLSKVVGDFRGWDRSADKYDTALRRLLSALQADD